MKRAFLNINGRLTTKDFADTYTADQILEYCLNNYGIAPFDVRYI